MKLLLLSLILGFGLSPPASAAQPAYAKGQNPWLGREMSRADLLPSLTRAADYLVRQQLDDGQFVYLNDPRGKARRENGDRYSLIRHLGAVYALLRAYETVQDPHYLEAARRGATFAKGFVVSTPKETKLVGLNGQPQLGESGFLLLDLSLAAKLDPKGAGDDASLAAKLAAFVTANLTFGNRFSTKEQWAECQTIMGLVLYQQVFAVDAKILDVAKTWLAAAQKDGHRSHWSIQAIAWLGRAAPATDKHLLEEGLLAAHAELSDVLNADSASETPRLVGSHFGKLNSCNASARNEGLIAAHFLAKQLFRNDEARFFLDRVKEHLAFALQFQYGMTGNFYEADPLKARLGRLFHLDGGVFDSPDAGYVRIDFVAHHVRALAAYLTSSAVPKSVGLTLPDLVGLP